MIEVVVSLSLATVCWLGQCQPALIGKDTPLGEFTMFQAVLTDPGFGGDALVFKDVPGDIPYALHRVWTGAPAQRRMERLSGPVSGRTITAGCINVHPVVYEQILECAECRLLRIIP